MCGVYRASLSHYIHKIINLERIYEPEYQNGFYCGPEQRKRDLCKLLPTVSSVNGCTLIQFLWDSCKSGRYKYRVKRYPYPYICRYYRDHCSSRSGQPLNVFLDKSCRSQNIIDDPHIRRKHKFKHQCRNRHRHHPGDHCHSSYGLGKCKILVEKQRKKKADQELEQQTSQCKYQSISHGLSEYLIMEYIDVICQSDKVLLTFDQIPYRNILNA